MSEELLDLPIVEELGAALVAGFRRREARRLRRPAVRAAALVAAATGAVAVLLSQLGGGAVSPAEAAAARVLRTAAQAAVAHPERLPKPGQFLFVRWRTVYLTPVVAGGGMIARGAERAPKAVVTTTFWDAWSATRVGRTNGRVLSVRFPTASARALWVRLGRPRLVELAAPAGIEPSESIAVGRGGLTVRKLLALPPNARVIDRRLFAGAVASNVLDYVRAIDLYPISARLRAAVYRALTLVPGIRYEGRARTLTGRVGVALGAPDGLVRADLIIDPRTGSVLGNRTVVIDSAATRLPAGTVVYEETVTERAITDTAAPPEASRLRR